jgi:hypothetical protein
MRIWSRAVAVWLLLMLAETVHGILRGLLLAPRVGDFRARQIGAGVGALLALGIACLLIQWIGARGNTKLIRIGLLWLVMTLCFEIALGRWTGASWERIASDYRVDQGGLLAFGMLVLAFSPWLAHRLRGGGAKPSRAAP